MNEEPFPFEERSEPADKEPLAFLVSQFFKEFPTDEECINELFRIAQIEICCHYCRSKNLLVSDNRRTGICADCHKKSWFTANTILSHMKKPRPRLAAIWLATKGVSPSSPAFASALGVFQSSAFEILKWARSIIQSNLPDDADVIDSSFFYSVFCKRSYETPARSHPRTEQDEMERLQMAEDTALHSVQVDQPCTGNEEIVSNLIDDKPIHSDEICEKANLPIEKVNAALTILEINGQIERLAGDFYIRCKKRPKLSSISNSVIQAIASFIKFVRKNHGAISRRYLQSYLASFWCYTASSQVLQEDLLHMCFRNMPFAEMNLRSVVTPLLVKIVAL